MPSNDRICVRLNEEALQKLQEAKENGYTTSQYIHKLINGSVMYDMNLVRSIMPHISNMQTELEFEEDQEVKNYLRKELNEICRCLRLLQDHT